MLKNKKIIFAITLCFIIGLAFSICSFCWDTPDDGYRNNRERILNNTYPVDYIEVWPYNLSVNKPLIIKNVHSVFVYDDSTVTVDLKNGEKRTFVNCSVIIVRKYNREY